MNRQNKRISRVNVSAMCFIGILGAFGCKQKNNALTSTLGYVLGPTNDISVFEKSDPRLTLYDFSLSSVLITTILSDGKVKFCSGTLIAPAPNESVMRVVTNHHCFAETDRDEKSKNTLLKEACVKTKIFLEFYKGSTLQSPSAECAPGSLRSNFEMDLAVFSLKEKLPSKYKPLNLFQGTMAELTGKSAMIVHYPDVPSQRESPGKGMPPLPVAAYTNNDCRIIGSFDSDEAKLDRTLPYGLKHSCDLIHGSSGSALLDPSNGEILGVNWGGIQINSGSGLNVNNVATAAPFVRSFLDQKPNESLLVKDSGAQQGKNAGVAATLGGGRDAQAQENSGSSEESRKKPGCGVVGLGTVSSHRLLLNVVILSLLAFLPRQLIRRKKHL